MSCSKHYFADSIIYCSECLVSSKAPPSSSPSPKMPSTSTQTGSPQWITLAPLEASDTSESASSSTSQENPTGTPSSSSTASSDWVPEPSTSAASTPTSSRSDAVLSTGNDAPPMLPKTAASRSRGAHDILATPCGRKWLPLLPGMRPSPLSLPRPLETSSSTAETLTTHWKRCSRCLRIARFSPETPRPFEFQTLLCNGCLQA